MLPSAAGSVRIFRVFGIDVYIHWGWLIVVAILVQTSKRYQDQTWAVAEVLTLFAIVLLHEFGHALACRSVGGVAKRIILWPLGGVAFVQPPRRPGAVLWSVAAGPLVNVILVPVTVVVVAVLGISQADFHDFQRNILPPGFPDSHKFAMVLVLMNLGLLIFNMLPIYPLDGGQILQAVLWFFMDQSKSLRIVAVIGLVAAALGVAAAVAFRRPWVMVMALFVGMRAWQGFQWARLLAEAEREERQRAGHVGDIAEF